MNGLFLTISTFLLSAIPFCLLTVVKIIPTIFRLWYLLSKYYFQSEVSVAIIFFCPYVVAMALVPFLTLLAAAFISVGGPFYCTYVSLTKYYKSESNPVSLGFLEGYEVVRDYDLHVNKELFKYDWSMFPYFPPERTGNSIDLD